jgi:hypothetical protein
VHLKHSGPNRRQSGEFVDIFTSNGTGESFKKPGVAADVEQARGADNGQLCCFELSGLMQLLSQGFYGQTDETIRDGIRGSLQEYTPRSRNDNASPRFEWEFGSWS